MSRSTADAIAILAVIAILALTAFVVAMNLVYGAPLDEVKWLTVPLGVAFGALTKYYWPSRAAVEEWSTQKFLDSKKSILLVEDNVTIIKGVRNNLRKRDFHGEIRVATSCEQALQMLKEEAPYQNQGIPDIVLLDLIWKPGQMDGRGLANAMADEMELADIPICALTVAEESDYADIAEYISCWVCKGKMSSLLDALVECTAPTPKQLGISQKLKQITSQRMKLLGGEKKNADPK